MAGYVQSFSNYLPINRKFDPCHPLLYEPATVKASIPNLWRQISRQQKFVTICFHGRTYKWTSQTGGRGRGSQWALQLLERPLKSVMTKRNISNLPY
jgi:hypothetical protein